MRPKLLEIEGLQSFCDGQTIDFEALGETGLFGIFGPTGSGKSTVLDAITLALYGDVKRAKSGVQGKSGTHGIINTNRKTVRVSFSFELLRDGVRKNYRVERVYQRKKGSENVCEAKIARLVEITDTGDIPLCDKANDVTNTVQELIGLNQTDFTRAVVLPQNSFQEFLMLGNSERRGMLERIFYLEEYGRNLIEKLNRKMAGLNDRIQNLSGELKGYEDASDDALEAARNAMSETSAERDKALNEFGNTEARYLEAKKVWELIQDLSVVMEREGLHFKAEEAILDKKAALERAVKAEGLIEQIMSIRDLKDKFLKTGIEIDEIKASLPPVRNGMEEARHKLDELKNEISAEQPILVERKARLKDALNLRIEIAGFEKRLQELNDESERLKAAISDKTDRINAESKEYESLLQDIAKLKSEAEELKIPPEYRKQIQDGVRLESEAEAAKKNAGEMEQKTGALRNSIYAIEQELGGIRGEINAVTEQLEELKEKKKIHDGEKPSDKKEVMARIERLHGLQSAYEVLRVRSSELLEIEKRLLKQKSDFESSALGFQSLDEARNKAELQFEGCRQLLESEQKKMDENIAFRLSKSLSEGEPCPVCGSIHHPKLASDGGNTDTGILERNVHNAGNNLSAAEKTLRSADKAYLAADEKLKALAGQISQTEEEYNRKSASVKADKEKFPEALKNLELDEIKQELDRMNDTGAKKLTAIEKWEREQEEFREKLQDIEKSINSLRIDENGKASEYKAFKDNLANLERTAVEAKDSAERKNREYSESIGVLGLISFSAELARLSETDSYLDGLQGKLIDTQKSAENLNVIREGHKEELQILNNEYVRTGAEAKSAAYQKSTLESGLERLAGGVPIEDEIRNIENKLEWYAVSEKQLQESLRINEKRVREIEGRLTMLENQKTIYEESLEKEEARLKTILPEKGFSCEDEVIASKIERADQKAIKHEIEVYEQEGFNLKAQRSITIKKLDSRTITEEEWRAASAAYSEIAAYKDECVAKSGIAAGRYEDVKSKHDRWVVINNEHKELDHKQSLLEQIKKLLGAGKGTFIDFIAEERLRYVAAKASETLGIMTRYKYALELDTENGFVIRDNANGGAHRMVGSLSGGETFLTSLSLALALSDQIQLKGQSPLEFFFLDEGFGTLDSGLLDTVMDSLDRLSRSDRVIGLISHVPEIKARLARRLIVDPPSIQGEGSKVRIEKG